MGRVIDQGWGERNGNGGETWGEGAEGEGVRGGTGGERGDGVRGRDAASN